MGWIKRNLYFTIGGVIALALLGWSMYYNFTSWRHNNTSLDLVHKAYDDLKNYYNQVPTPSETNIFIENLQREQLTNWISQARAHFIPIAPIPDPADGVVTTEAFSRGLSKTIHDMQVAAVEENVDLPADYGFSFAAERNLVTFSPGSLNALASHLGEVKAICDILFAARVNGIDIIQREVVSDNDAAGPQSDYLAEKTTTLDLATITPYAITFRCFSGDLGNVLSRLASSDHGFIVTGINVTPAGGAMTAANGTGNQPTPTSTGLVTVLDEQLLRVSLGIEVVKLNKQ
ncbi:MAG TPA: Amuc_1100 family pilus-like protein [Alphaproteobacteria bacterium]|nr:Amuc_1100 family pilus-like protein [Alphaproteobacteria bacterium]